MNHENPLPSPAQHDPLQRLLDEVICDQRQRNLGQDRLSVEDYLRLHPRLAERPDFIVDLVYHEFVLQYQNKQPQESIETQPYLDRFPDLAEELEKQFIVFFGLDPDSDNAPAVIQSSNALSPSPRFELQKKLGSGGFANVYRAWDHRLQRVVAVKIAKQAIDPESRLFQRFEREANSAARLSHPAVVGVHEFGYEDGRPFIVSELMEGGSLSEKIANSKISFGSSTDCLIAICDAVDYAHQYGVVHRDIKPANILFDRQDAPHLADFGLATLTDSDMSLTQIGDVLGTPAYMSPEQAQGQNDVGPSSDIYSLGVVLYQLICGQLPFEGRTSSVMQQAIRDEPIAPRSHVPRVPLDLQTICLKAMAKNPSDRYSTARAMAEDLRRYRKGDVILARPISPFERLNRFIRRHPIGSAMGMLLLLFTGFILGGAFSYFDIVQQRNRAELAESQTRSLLAEEAANSGKLAFRQGQTRAAAKHFRDALQRGAAAPDRLRLKIAQCEIINGRLQAAVEQVTVLGDSVLEDEVALLKCQLALLGRKDFGSPLTLLDQLQIEKLPRADQEYAIGLRSVNSRKALGHFKTALHHDSYHHGARQMAMIVALSLAELDEVLHIAEMSQQLFPDDHEFLLIEALARAATGTLPIDHQKIDDAALNADESEAWKAFATFIFELQQIPIASGDDAFNYVVLIPLMNQLEDQFAPLMKSRQWFLPPHIAAASSRFFNHIRNHPQALNPGQVINPIEMEFARAHSESTLLSLIARRVLDTGKDVFTLLEAQSLFEQARTSSGFCRDAQWVAQMGAFATTIYLDHLHHHQPKRNATQALSLLDEIKPNTIDNRQHLRVMTLYALQHDRWDLASKFAPPWLAAARQSADTPMIRDALWHHAVIAEHQGDWLKVVTHCDEILQLNLKPPAPGFEQEVQSLRLVACGHLLESMTDFRAGFSWQSLVETFLIRDQWHQAATTINQWKSSDLGEAEQQLAQNYQEICHSATQTNWKSAHESVVALLSAAKDQKPSDNLLNLEKKFAQLADRSKAKEQP